MNRETAYLIGALRDGNFTRISEKGIYRIRLYQKNRKWLEVLAKIIEKVFGKTPSFYFDERRGVWALSITSKKIFEELFKLSEFTGNQSTWLTPSWIRYGPLDFKSAYVRGFFDAEGSINSFEKTGMVSEKDIRVYIAQANKSVLEEIREIILTFRVRCGNVCGPYIKRGTSTKMFALIIHGSSEALNFYKCFGSDHPDKILRFELLRTAKGGDKDSSVASLRSVLLAEGKIP